MRFANLTMTTRRLPSLVAAAAVALALSACSGQVQPTLSGFAAARDQAARTEAAASARATQLAENATECAACSTALRSVASASDTRLQALGGLWDPWGGPAPEGKSSPPAVSEAPTELAAFVSWLARTATRDLAIAADPKLTSSEDARILAASALGRYSSAVSVASAYGINLNAGATQAAAINDHVNASSLDGVQTWSIDAFSDSTISTTFAPSGTDVASSQELSAAVALWDCTASTLPKAHASADTLSVDETYSVSGELLTRAQIALQAGAADTRTPRCELPYLDAATLSTNLLAADTAMLASDSEAVRSAGLSAALVDIEQWAPHTTLPALIGTK